MARPQFRLLLVFLLMTLAAVLGAWRNVVEQERELNVRPWREECAEAVARLQATRLLDPLQEAVRLQDIEYYRTELEALNGR